MCCPARARSRCVVALDLFALLIGLIGGRVVPAFTRNALTARGEADRVRAFALRDRLAIGIPRPAGARRSCRAQAARRRGGPGRGVAQRLAAVRLAGRRTLGQPILWVLQLGYGWLVIGLAWKGLVDLTGFLPPADALHGLAIGAVGTMTLGIMSRATLGHTGRPLVAPTALVASYVLITAAAVARLAASLRRTQTLPC